MEETRKPRSGFTTGTCAAACVRAAVLLCLTGKCPETVWIRTPSGRDAAFKPEQTERTGEMAACFVRKDAGDDPDVTNGTRVGALVYAGKAPDREYRFYESSEYPGLYLTGGTGIGTVTKPGLSCPVGYPAINPVPRTMIFAEAERARIQAGQAGRTIWMVLSIPDGERLAARTFNPNLGIQGGLSVLGTSGIVNPMSEDALLATIRLDIRVRAAQGQKLLAVAPGNYGERFLRDEMGLSMDAFVKCSNYIGDTFRMLEEEGISRVLLAGHVGKLVKVAGGVLNTHSRFGDRRMEILEQCAVKAGFQKAGALRSMNTTEEAAEFLLQEGMLAPVMKQVAEQVRETLAGVSRVRTEVLLFSSVHGLLARTSGAVDYVRELRKAGDGGSRIPETGQMEPGTGHPEPGAETEPKTDTESR